MASSDGAQMEVDRTPAWNQTPPSKQCPNTVGDAAAIAAEEKLADRAKERQVDESGG